jgi:VIT1/CCC1 family predicted Fe2+/Mn2+ transporter
MPPSRGPAATSSRAAPPARGDVRRWRRHLADERLEASVYRDLAARRSGEERAILLELADAEGRHAAHWERLLEAAGQPGARSRTRPSLRSALLGLLARRFGSVFVLALAQRAETRSPYADDPDATAAMAADEQIHAEVVRGLAERGREQVSGTFRAAVFGANDGLVSNLALVLGIAGSGAGSQTVLLTGLAGLLSGALSMGAGEYISVRSQRELLAASTMGAGHVEAYPHLDVDANELALVYRARGMSPSRPSSGPPSSCGPCPPSTRPARPTSGTSWSAAGWPLRCPASPSSPAARPCRCCRSCSACPARLRWSWPALRWAARCC